MSNNIFVFNPVTGQLDLVNESSGGGGTGNLNSINGLTTPDQLITTDETGSDVSVSSAVNTHTIHIPIASALATGKLSTSDWAAFNAKIDSIKMGAANGVATLDNGGKIPVSQLPASLFIYKGTWDASTNTPTLTDGVGTNGWFYIVSVAGTVDLGSGPLTFQAGDWVLYNGTIWEQSHNGNNVDSVNGLTGIVVLTTANISDTVNKRYVTDGDLVKLSNTSGTNTGDETTSTIKTKLGAASSVADGYLTSTNWNTFNNKSEKEAPQTLKTIHVAVYGSDTTGDGSTALPYQTINKAISVISAPFDQDHHWIIRLGPGRFIETADIVLPPYVDLIGDSHRSTYVRVNGGTNSVKPSSAWATSSSWTTLKGIYFGGSTKLDFDLQAIGGSNSNIVLQDLWANTNVNLKGRNAGGGDYLEAYDTLFLGPVLIDQTYVQWQGGVFANTLTSNASLAALSGTYINCNFGANVTLNGTFQQDTQFSASPFSTSGITLTTTGTVNLYVDSLSIPKKPSQVFSVGTTVTYLNDSTTLAFTPAVPGNWTSVPTEVKTALDTLAAKPSVQTTVQRTVLTGTDILNKYVTLGYVPTTASNVQLTVIGGPDQDYGTDFTVSGTQLTWNSLTLDGVLTTGDVLKIEYTH